MTEAVPKPLPIGTTVKLAPGKLFKKYCEQHVPVCERIPPEEIMLIAGRNGTVISSPMLCTNGLEMRRVSVLTKDGSVVYHHVPLRLMKDCKTTSISKTKIVDNSKRLSDSSSEDEEYDEDRDREITRNHILSVLRDVTCRTGKRAVNDEADAVKSELILTALKKEISLKNGPHDTNRNCNTNSGDVTIKAAIISDGDDLMGPVGTCVVDDKLKDSCDKDKSHVDDKVLDVESTTINTDREHVIDDSNYINDTSEKFSSTIRSMVGASDRYATSIKNIISQRNSKKIHNNSNTYDSFEDQSHDSEFRYLNVQEIDAFGIGGTNLTTPHELNSLCHDRNEIINGPLPHPAGTFNPHIKGMPIRLITIQPPSVDIKALPEIQSVCKNELNDDVDAETSLKKQSGDWVASFECNRHGNDGESSPALLSLQRFFEEGSVSNQPNAKQDYHKKSRQANRSHSERMVKKQPARPCVPLSSKGQSPKTRLRTDSSVTEKSVKVALTISKTTIKNPPPKKKFLQS